MFKTSRTGIPSFTLSNRSKMDLLSDDDVVNESKTLYWKNIGRKRSKTLKKNTLEE